MNKLVTEYKDQIVHLGRQHAERMVVELAGHALKFIFDEVKQRFFAELTITNDDTAFTWMVAWMSKQPALRTARRSKIQTIQSMSSIEDYQSPRERRRQMESIFSPGEGTHRVFYRGSVLWITRSADEKMISRESITVRMFSRDASLLRELLAEARDQFLDTEDPGLRVSVANAGYWTPVQRQPVREQGSVLLPGDTYERLESDLGGFLGNKHRYTSLGIPFRRGYLFHGVAGAGKTSTIMALASRFGLDLYILNLSAASLDDSGLVDLLAEVPEGSAVLMEDVDAIYNQRKLVKGETRVSFSALLNALDGVAAGSGRILFMTTNHLDRLDDALIRPGRVDYRVPFDVASDDQIHRLFSRFYEGVEPHLADSFTRMVGGNGLIMCDVQEFLLHRWDNPLGAVAEFPAALPELLKRHDTAPEPIRRARRNTKLEVEQIA